MRLKYEPSSEPLHIAQYLKRTLHAGTNRLA